MPKHNTVTEASDTPFDTGDFDAILDRSADEIKEPGRAPSGPWVLRCVGAFIRKTPAEDREANPDLPIGSVTFYHTPHEPLEGVDADLVEAGDWRGKRIVTRRNIKEAGDDAKIKALVMHHGVDPNGRSLREMLDAVKGRFVRGNVSVYSYTRKADNETIVENQIGNFTTVNG